MEATKIKCMTCTRKTTYDCLNAKNKLKYIAIRSHRIPTKTNIEPTRKNAWLSSNTSHSLLWLAPRCMLASPRSPCNWWRQHTSTGTPPLKKEHQSESIKGNNTCIHEENYNVYIDAWMMIHRKHQLSKLHGTSDTILSMFLLLINENDETKWTLRIQRSYN